MLMRHLGWACVHRQISTKRTKVAHKKCLDEYQPTTAWMAYQRRAWGIQVELWTNGTMHGNQFKSTCRWENYTYDLRMSMRRPNTAACIRWERVNVEVGAHDSRTSTWWPRWMGRKRFLAIAKLWWNRRSDKSPSNANHECFQCSNSACALSPPANECSANRNRDATNPIRTAVSSNMSTKIHRTANECQKR